MISNNQTTKLKKIDLSFYDWIWTGQFEFLAKWIISDVVVFPRSKPIYQPMALRHLNRHLLPLYVRPEITFTHGKGSVLHSTCGRSFLDFTAGIAVNALGHGDETIAKVMADQTAKLVHISNLYHNEHAGPFATRIVESMVSHGAWQDQQVFFCSSGTEANEGALKFARKYCRSTASKTDILAFKGGFHGRSMGALSATFNPKYQEPFQPLVPGFGVAAFNDMDAIGRITSSTAAVLIEPIQGEGGVHVADMAFIKAVRDKCTEMGALLILDEVQCGLARTGKLHAYENFGIVPDILTMAKPIGNLGLN